MGLMPKRSRPSQSAAAASSYNATAKSPFSFVNAPAKPCFSYNVAINAASFPGAPSSSRLKTQPSSVTDTLPSLATVGSRQPHQPRFTGPAGIERRVQVGRGDKLFNINSCSAVDWMEGSLTSRPVMRDMLIGADYAAVFCARRKHHG